jgi:hypothetical protein
MSAAPMTGFYAFVAERIRHGAMGPASIHRANVAFRALPKALACRAGRFESPGTAGRAGPYRVAEIALAQANAYVTQFHRHLNGVVGHVASLALYDDAGMRGVLILGRPLARHQDDGSTAEVLRVCTDGSRNACSKLYGAARRWAKRNGRRRLVTYTLPEEPGASLRGAGFICTGATRGGSWNRTGRARADKAPTVAKTRWEMRV